MYKSASSYLGSDRNRPVSHLMEPYKYIPNQVREEYQEKEMMTPPPPIHKPPRGDKPIEMRWETAHFKNLSDPRVWGPAFWFGLHTSAAHYPIHPSPIFKDRMKARILAIPFEIPCPQCKPHASAFIENRRQGLDNIVSSRQNLFNFYVDFHNKVNERYGKPHMSYEDAMKMYSGGAEVKQLRYS